jgi:hypothetical protein
MSALDDPEEEQVERTMICAGGEANCPAFLRMSLQSLKKQERLVRTRLPSQRQLKQRRHCFGGSGGFKGALTPTLLPMPRWIVTASKTQRTPSVTATPTMGMAFLLHLDGLVECACEAERRARRSYGGSC